MKEYYIFDVKTLILIWKRKLLGNRMLWNLNLHLIIVVNFAEQTHQKEKKILFSKQTMNSLRVQ